MEETRIAKQYLSTVAKVFRFFLFKKIGRIIFIFFVLTNVSSFIGTGISNVYYKNFADSSEIKVLDITAKGKHNKNISLENRATPVSAISSIVIFALSVILFIVIIIKSKKNKKQSNVLEYDPKYKNKNFSFSFEIPLTEKNKKVIISNPFRGIFIQGGAGSGKSESTIIPFIKQCADKSYCGIIYDFKNPELINYALHYYQNSEIQTHVIDFKNPANSARINPLNTNSSISKIVDLTQALFYNLSPESLKHKDFWVNESINLLTGLMIYFKNNQQEYFTIPHIVSALIYCDTRKVVKQAINDIDAYPYLSSINQSIQNKAETQFAGIISTLVGKLAILSNPESFYILSGNDVDLDLNNPDNPTMLLIGNNSTMPDVFNPLISCIITACARNMNEDNKHHSIIMLDEAPTIYVPKIEQIPATARSSKIVLAYACQDHSQNISKYGNENATTLLSNLGNQFYFRTINKQTAQLISDLFDKQDVEYKSTNKSKNDSVLRTDVSFSTGQSFSHQERRRVKISDIVNLHPGEFYALIAEGNYREVLNKKALIKLDDKPEITLKPKTTNEAIRANFEKIIEEVKNIFN